MKLPSFQGENVPLSDSFCLFFITKGIRCHQSIQPVRPTSNHQPSGESAKPPHPKPPSPREVPRRGGGSQSAKHSRNTPSVSLTRASSLKEGASGYAPTQSLPHRWRCPEGAEGVAAEHASNHRPSGESAPGTPLGEGGRRSRDGGSPCQNCRFTPSVSLTRASSLKEGASGYAPTQSLPHRGRCPEGAEGVAAEHASNHRPSGESAKALSALRGRHGVAKGAPLGRTPQTFPPVTAERSKAERAP